MYLVMVFWVRKVVIIFDDNFRVSLASAVECQMFEECVKRKVV